MTNYENLILNSLRAGTDVDTVASEITAALNSAKATIQKENQAKKKESDLRAAYGTIRQGMLMYIKVMYPNLYEEAEKFLTIDMMEEALDSATKSLDAAQKLVNKTSNLNRIVNGEDADDIIKDFLRDMGL